MEENEDCEGCGVSVDSCELDSNGLVPCAQCGWYASEGEMEDHEDGRICSNCVSENEENEDE